MYVDAAMPAVMGRTIAVNAGDDLQAAINAAQPGDELVLQAGATFTGPFTLPAKPGDAWITIRSSGTLPAPGTRVTPAQAAQMPKLVSRWSTEPALRTAPGAHHYRLIGLEVTAVAGATTGGALIALGDGSAAQSTLAQQPHHLVLDRLYVHGTSTLSFQRCIALNSGAAAVIDSWIAECHGKGFDSQAIGGWNGTGPYKIVNNRLEGAGENVMFGGADPAIPGLVPSDIEIRRNHVIKPLAWKGVWSAKNLFELKNAQRVLVEGNVFENSWVDGQTGFAFVLWSVNQSGSCTWCVTQDVTVRYNVLRNSAAGFQLTARYTAAPAIEMRRVTLAHNLSTGIGAAGLGSNGRMYQIGGAIEDLAIVHNTGLSPSQGIVFTSTPPEVLPRLVVRDNIFGGGAYQVFSSYGQGQAAWDRYAGAGSSFAGNVVVGSTVPLPPGNFAPSTAAAVGFVNLAADDLRLRSRSAYADRATNGGDLGANLDNLQAHTAGVALAPSR